MGNTGSNGALSFSAGGTVPRDRTGTTVRWAVLRAPTVTIDGIEVPLAARPRAVLLSLLLEANEDVPTDRLIDRLWGHENPPPTARNSIARFVADLRRALGDHHGRIVTASGSYRLVVEPGERDIDRVEAVLATASLRQVGDLEASVAALRGALDLTGMASNPLLSHLSDVAAVERSHDELRIAVIEALISARQRLGEHGELIALLEEAVELHPYHEVLWHGLMTSLDASGRPAEALQAAQRLRALLKDIGLRPSESIQRAESDILGRMQGARDEADAERVDASVAPSDVHGSRAPGDEFRLPLPRVFTELPRFPLVGRAEQLERVTVAWRHAVLGTTRLVLVSGEAGAGKTRLAGELARNVHQAAHTVLYGRCDEDLGVSYQPFVEAFTHAVTKTPTDRLDDVLDPSTGALAEVVPTLQHLLPEAPSATSDSEISRYRIFEGFATWLESLSRLSPVLLVLDDLQWADEPTLLLLRHLAHSDRELRVLIAATLRDDLEVSPQLESLLSDLRRTHGVERLHLDGLDAGSVAELVERVAFKELNDDPALARSIRDRTGGNPFFVIELLLALVEQGSIHRSDDGLWSTGIGISDVGVPLGVKEVLEHRLQSLTPRARTTIETAAVVGRTFGLEVVEAVCECDADDAIDDLAQAAVASFVVDVSEGRVCYRFAHDLVQETVLDAIPLGRRRRLHAAAAAALERLEPGDPAAHREAVAHHRWSSRSDPVRTLEAVVAVAEHEMTRFADRNARIWLERAVGLLDDAEADASTRALVLTMTGEVLNRLGDPTHREVLLEAGLLAEQAHDAGLMARAALANGRGWQSDLTGVDEERVGALERSLELLGDDDPPTQALLLARLAVETILDHDSERQSMLIDGALVMARQAGDPRTLASVLSTRQAFVGHDSIPVRRRENEELVPLVDRLDDPAMRFNARVFGFFCQMQARRVEGARILLDEAGVIAASTGRPAFQWISASLQCSMARFDGDLDRAEEALDTAWEISTGTGIADAPVFDAIMRSTLLVDRADDASLAATAESVIALPIHYAAPTILPCLFRCTVDGDPTEIHELLTRTAESPHVLWSDACWPLETAMVLAAAMAGAASALALPSPWVTPLFDSMDRWRGQLFGNLQWHGPTETYLAAIAPLAGRPGQTHGLVDDALAMTSELRSPTLDIEARIFGATGLRISGDCARADQLVEEAITIGDRIGSRFPRFAAEHFPALSA